MVTENLFDDFVANLIEDFVKHANEANPGQKVNNQTRQEIHPELPSAKKSGGGGDNVATTGGLSGS